MDAECLPNGWEMVVYYRILILIYMHYRVRVSFLFRTYWKGISCDCSPRYALPAAAAQVGTMYV